MIQLFPWWSNSSESNRCTFPENQRTAYTFTFFDPEPEYSNFADYDVSPDSASIKLEQDGDYFEIVSLLGMLS